MRIKKEENEYENEYEHENEHKNEHECSICEISFSLATSLEKHVKVLHLEIEKNESTKEFIPEPKTDIKLEKTQQNGHLETNSNSMQESKSAILLKHDQNLQKNELTQKNDLPSDHGFDTSKQKPNNPESGISKSNVRKQLDSKPFKCGKCALRFKCENHLEIHDQIHSNSNFESYACKFCAKTFKRIEEVVVHERVHTGEKPLSCQFCDKTFTQLINKKRHELLHNGKKPHSSYLW